MKDTFVEKVATRKARVGVIGMGYVGLPLLLEFAKQGFPTLGLDIDSRKVESLKAGRSYIKHIPDEPIARQFGAGGAADATTDYGRAATCDALIICVPTPLTHHRDPDMSYIESTAHSVGPHIRRGQLVSLESTTYPGTTEEVLIPILEKHSGLKAGVDFLVAFSPEREDPSNPDFRTATIPKVVGGLDPASLEAARALYGAVICRTVPVSSCRAAEATKLMENIFRCINIALVNELKIVFTEMGIDVWEVIEAAKTKPFGYMPFYPGPGLGGHCIPIDPFYLTWKAREFGVPTKFIELAGEINTGMPDYVITRTMLALSARGKPIKGAKILLVGLAYKKNVDDDRESPTYVLWQKLVKLGAHVAYHDPYCPVVRPTREHPGFAGVRSRTWEEIARDGYDAAIISTAHDNVDHAKLAAIVPLVVDSRGALPALPNVVKA
jgi:UDP-N-acetyl-D-glucosamine dehydrogenase